MACANRSPAPGACAWRWVLAPLALGLGPLALLPIRAQDMPMQTQPPARRQFTQEPVLQPQQRGSQTIQQLDELLLQQQRQVTPADTLRNLNQLDQQQNQNR